MSGDYVHRFLIAEELPGSGNRAASGF